MGTNISGLRRGGPGRPRGSKNRVSREARALFEQLGGPDGEAYAQQLHNLAVLPHDDPHVRVKALALIVPLLWRKQAEQLEVSGPDGGPVQYAWKD